MTDESNHINTLKLLTVSGAISPGELEILLEWKLAGVKCLGRSIYYCLDTVAYACYPSTQKAEAGNLEFKTGLGYAARCGHQRHITDICRFQWACRDCELNLFSGSSFVTSPLCHPDITLMLPSRFLMSKFFFRGALNEREMEQLLESGITAGQVP